MAVYKRSNGKWYCQFMVKGERVHKLLDGAKTQAQALELENAERYRLRQSQLGLQTNAPKYTFGQLMQKYLSVQEANNKSVRESKIYAKYLTEYFGKSTQLGNIKPSDIEKFKTYLLGKNRTKATVNRYLSALRRAYNIMIADDELSTNPVNKVKKLPEDNKRYRYLTKEEWTRLRKYLPPQMLQIVTFALQTGFRKRNVLECRWEQVNFDLGTIELLKQNNKGKKPLCVPLTPALRSLLATIEPDPSGYIFPNPRTGAPYRDIRKTFNRALASAGIEDFHFHDLRRTVGTWLVSNGVDLRTTQNILGHSDISTTERYLSITPEQTRRAMKVLISYM